MSESINCSVLPKVLIQSFNFKEKELKKDIKAGLKVERFLTRPVSPTSDLVDWSNDYTVLKLKSFAFDKDKVRSKNSKLFTAPKKLYSLGI